MASQLPAQAQTRPPQDLALKYPPEQKVAQRQGKMGLKKSSTPEAAAQVRFYQLHRSSNRAGTHHAHAG